MKRWTVISSVVSILLVASILTFGLTTEIASAHGNHSEDCTGPHKNDLGCDNTGTTYSVDVITGGTSGVDTSGDCEGTSAPSNHLSVKFPTDDRTDCGPVPINGGGYSGFVYLLEIAVREKRNGDLVSFFFTSCEGPPCGNENVWHADSLPAMIEPMDDGFEITGIGEGVNSSWYGFHLTKTHQPGRNTVSTIPITVGTIVYTPD